MNKLTRRSFLTSSAMGVSGVAGLAQALATPADAPEAYQLTRKIPVEDGFDLVVAGGGPAGAAAAICAGRRGLKVLLVEATGCLGGMGTSALVSNWFGLSDGKQTIIGGLLVELIQAMCRDQQVSPNAIEALQKNRLIGSLGFNPEALKALLDKLCQAAKVEVRFFTRVIDAEVDPQTRRVKGVVTNSVEGYRYLRAKMFMDGTGDGVLADLCGVKCRAAGRDTRNIMPPTLCARVSDIDFEHFPTAKRQQEMLEKAIADGFFTQADRHVPGLFRTGLRCSIMNSGHLFHTNALQTRSLSDAMMLGRRLAQEYAALYRKYLPECANMQVMETGALLGVRESRRIVGEYELNYDDFKARRQFPDQIALCTKSVDIHVYDLSAEEYKRYHEEFTQADHLKRGEKIGIPYGVLVPKGWTNLWVAGRCVSSDVKVHGVIRDQPSCVMMGQAAGTAIAQSLATGQTACDLDTARLVETLRRAGACLPQEKLSRQMTRA